MTDGCNFCRPTLWAVIFDDRHCWLSFLSGDVDGRQSFLSADTDDRRLSFLSADTVGCHFCRPTLTTDTVGPCSSFSQWQVVHMQVYNLLLPSGQRCYVVGKVTTSPVEANGSLLPRLWLKWLAGWLPQRFTIVQLITVIASVATTNWQCLVHSSQYAIRFV